MTSAEIRAWFREYEQNLRNEARNEGREEGRKEGHEEGRREGRKERQRHLILRQLRIRFGELPAAAVARLEAAERADLERWAKRLLTAPTLADLFDDPS